MKSEGPWLRASRVNRGRSDTLSGTFEVLDRVSGGAKKVLEYSASSCKANMGVLGLSSLKLLYVVDPPLEVIGVLGLFSLGMLYVLDFLEVGAL